MKSYKVIDDLGSVVVYYLRKGELTALSSKLIRAENNIYVIPTTETSYLTVDLSEGVFDKRRSSIWFYGARTARKDRKASEAFLANFWEKVNKLESELSKTRERLEVAEKQDFIDAFYKDKNG